MEFVTTAILSGLIYDIVKRGVKVTTKLVINKTAEHQNQWPADEATTEKVVNRINELGYIEGETQTEYCQRLGNDRPLTQLFSSVNQTSITQNIDNLQGVGQVKGDMVNPVFNFNSQGSVPKKS